MSASSGKPPAATAGGSVLFNVYGFEVEIRSSSAAALNGLAADFSHFRSSEARHPSLIELFEESPPYDAAPPGVATVYTPRNISFREGELTYIDYFGLLISCSLYGATTQSTLPEPHLVLRPVSKFTLPCSTP